MIDKKETAIGFLLGLLLNVLGVFLFVILFLKTDLKSGLINIYQLGYLRKIMALSGFLNLIAFFILLRFDKDKMAFGVVLATIFLTILTLLLLFF
jgi:hypothetical protein